MNNQLNSPLSLDSKAFQVSNTGSGYKHSHSLTSRMKRVKCNNVNHKELKIGKGPEMETEQCEALNIIKHTSENEGSSRKLSLYVDDSARELNATPVNFTPEIQLFNNKFITSYMCLNHKEKQVLKQLSMMKTSDEIAKTLLVSLNTIKNHRKNIRQKLKLTSREDHSRFLYWVRGFVL